MELAAESETVAGFPAVSEESENIISEMSESREYEIDCNSGEDFRKSTELYHRRPLDYTSGEDLRRSSVLYLRIMLDFTLGVDTSSEIFNRRDKLIIHFKNKHVELLLTVLKECRSDLGVHQELWNTRRFQEGYHENTRSTIRVLEEY